MKNLNGQGPIESAGSHTLADQWFKIGLPSELARLLKKAAQRLFVPGDKQTSGQAAHHLLATALAHLDEVQEMALQDLKHAKAQGLFHVELYRIARAKQLLDKAEAMEELLGREESLLAVQLN